MRFLVFVLLCTFFVQRGECASGPNAGLPVTTYRVMTPGLPKVSVDLFGLTPYLGWRYPSMLLPVAVNPTSVLWPAGTMQNFGTVNCGSGAFNVSVETFKPGVTDQPGQGTNIHCVVHLGKVTSFPSGSWTCVQNFSMTYSTDNGPNDVFTVAINTLPPGLYEFTCACSDQGVFTDPLTAPGITWIGTSNPPNNFVDAQVTVANAALNDDCDPTTAIPLSAAPPSSTMIAQLMAKSGLNTP